MELRFLREMVVSLFVLGLVILVLHAPQQEPTGRA